MNESDKCLAPDGAVWTRRRMLPALVTWPLPGCAAKGGAATQPLPDIATTESGYRLVKDWDFVRGIRSQEALAAEFHTRFIYDGGRLDHLNDEWQRYRDNHNHVFTRSGLALVAKVGAGFKPGGVDSGMLRSRWSGQFGVFEISMRCPKGLGTWPAFWLNPQDGVWPPEIDVVEIVNNGRDTTRHSFHYLHGRGAKNKVTHFSKLDKHGRYESKVDFSDGFHRFAVEWTANTVSHHVDGVLVTKRDFAWVHDDGRDAGPAHVLVNLAIGGKWPGAPTPRSLPAALEIEYIRVWQR